ncbi:MULTISPECIES: hypothetical protein [unclassified Pseudoalteromonas]|uniref:hypothetical protein n=1 Tax=unclassified Pseudoalteromonas TaxID=194690 RepID=UPI00209736E5|nr:hypothetical protein [Pseudoalteromonas sp. XMcav2-N]MCO7189499.1 hypothetical protein [Pseudoalteromonas sp. XMcav2-N]
MFEQFKSWATSAHKSGTDMFTSSLVTLSDVQIKTVFNQGVHDIAKYSRNGRSVYIKHVYLNRLNDTVKPNISASDIDFFRSLDQIFQYCYVLVYVKCPRSNKYDTAFFLDDYEAIKGISKSEAMQRQTDLTSIARIIRSELL